MIGDECYILMSSAFACAPGLYQIGDVLRVRKHFDRGLDSWGVWRRPGAAECCHGVVSPLAVTRDSSDV